MFKAAASIKKSRDRLLDALFGETCGQFETYLNTVMSHATLKDGVLGPSGVVCS